MVIRIAKTALSARLGEQSLASGHGARRFQELSVAPMLVLPAKTQGKADCCRRSYLISKGAMKGHYPARPAAR